MSKHLHIILILLVLAPIFTACENKDLPAYRHSGKVVDGIGENSVTDFVFDSEGYVWMMGVDMPYLFKTDGQNIIQYSYDSSDPGSLSSNKINDIVIGEDNVVLLATQKGVDRYDRDNGCFTHMRLDDTNSYVLSIASSISGRICIATRRNILEYDRSSEIFLRKLEMPFVAASGEPDIFFDSFGNLWVLFEGRLDCYDERYNVLFSRKDITGKVVYDRLESIWFIEDGCARTINVRTLLEKDVADAYPGLAGRVSKSLALLDTGMILVETDNECVCVDENKGSVVHPEQASGNLSRAIARFRNGATALAMGPDGSLWVALNPTGYICYPPVLGAISPYRGLVQSIMDGHVRNYVQDRNYFWTMQQDGIHCYDIAAKKEIGTVHVAQFFAGSIPFNISLNADGKVLVSGAPRRSDPFVEIEVNSSGKPVVSRVVENPKDGMAAISIHNDIYYASRGARLSAISGTDVNDFGGIFNDNACYASMVRTLFDGSILVCYTDHCPVIFNPRRGEAKILEVDNLRQVYFATSVEDVRGNLWLGSTDNGLFVYNPRTDKISHVDVFPAMQVSSMAADGDGNVFVMDGSNNVYMLDVAAEKAQRVWTDASDYPLPRQLFTLPDHTVALIGASDFAWFSRENLLSSQTIDSPSHVIISSGKKVLAAFSTESYPSRKSVIRLNRHTEGLNLHIGSVNGGARNVSYTYMYDINGFKTGPRESFDNAFIPLYGVTKARNKVKFWIKDNNLGTESLPFTIVIKMNLLWFEVAIPALILILVIASAILGYIFLKKKREANSERLKREMTEKMNMENIDFFANISHEFRTPLTLIHGAVSSLESTVPADASKARGVIKRSTDRLLKLVSQMLDFNKLDHGVLKLNVKMEPVSEIFELTKMNFEIGASMKNIDLTLNTPETALMGWVDRDKIEKILYNLCSNALKFTPPGGAVTIDMSEDDQHVLHVSVSDTGVGIPEEDLDAVFDRFYQTSAAKKSGGTGIGLYYTRALVNLHHGSIGVKVRKTEDGRTEGSVFSFTIPMAESEYSDVEKAAATDKVVSIDRKEMMSEYVEESSASVNTSDKKQKLLIIDDDYEVVYYLKSLFADTYNVSFRFDAMSGYKMIEEFVPDVIICDVMMVDVDGIQLCRMVKDNIAMSHIPFIMLTAKSTMEDQIKSLGVGADAYVVKPFNSEYLQALVKSMLENRARVKEMLGRSTQVPTASKDALSYQDRSFMERMYSAMEESLQNGELDIDSMAETLGVSRSKFYYKLKALTGQTPNEFFTTYKLNYSVQLLKDRKYKIAAIADMLGFSSASHFTSLFKKQFGVLPSQYSETETKTNN